MDYTLQFNRTFDKGISNSSDVCHVGNIAGLDYMFSHTYIRKIPYLSAVEVPVTFAATGLCRSFEIDLHIIATCEMPSPGSDVYQYGVQYNPNTGGTEILYDYKRGPESSTIKLFMSWGLVSDTHSTCDCNAVGDGEMKYSADGERKRSLGEKVFFLLFFYLPNKDSTIS